MIRSSDTSTINWSWLLKLRWGALIGQAVVIGFVELAMGIALPLVDLFAIIGIAFISNLVAYRITKPTEQMTLIVLGLDIVLLTGLLHLSGGTHNPFNFLYLVYLTEAAVVIGPRATWALTVMALLCFGLLFALEDPQSGIGHAVQMEIHLKGMWVAFAVAAFFIVYFVTRVRQALEERDRQLARARERAEHHDRLASLATLAGGAAHELATPLSTIAVIAGELTRLVDEGEKEQLQDDASLIAEQVDRCQEILRRMGHDQAGEETTLMRGRTLVDAATNQIKGAPRVEIHLPPEIEKRIDVAPQTTSTALKAVIKNARDASSTDQVVHVDLHHDEASCRVVIRDSGKGMDRHTLEHAMDPFFTTKSVGEGMGLGLFLAREVFERLGGHLSVESTSGQGTTVTVSIPWAASLQSSKVSP